MPTAEELRAVAEKHYEKAQYIQEQIDQKMNEVQQLQRTADQERAEAAKLNERATAEAQQEMQDA